MTSSLNQTLDQVDVDVNFKYDHDHYQEGVRVRDLGYRLMDADNHYYESPDCFSRHIEHSFRDRAVRAERRDDGWVLVHDGSVIRYAAADMFDEAEPPGSLLSVLRDRSLNSRRDARVAVPHDPAYVNRSARLERMDTQGLQSAIMLPSVGVTVEQVVESRPTVADGELSGLQPMAGRRVGLRRRWAPIRRAAVEPSRPRRSGAGTRACAGRRCTAVNGDAVGAGLFLPALSDFVLAADTARFGDPHVKVGLVASGGGALIASIGVHHTKELLLSGDLVTAQRARDMGLVGVVCTAAELMPRAHTRAAQLAALPTEALRSTKRCLNRHVDVAWSLTWDSELAFESMSASTEAHRRAVAAFAKG